jgi:hypothetical protein
MMNTAYIETARRTSPLGKIEQETYKWVGKSPYVRISRMLLREITNDYCPKALQLGPYRLLMVDAEPWLDFVLYVRSDKFGALRVALYRSTRLLDLIYRRLIITLAVWGLAEFTPAAIPSWRDIKLIRRLLKK